MTTASIFYFSGTGNSLITARHLSAGLEGATVVPVTAALGRPECASVTIGIVFPVYMFGLPLIVRDFLGKVQAGNRAYIFTVATMGGLPGLAHSQADAILRRRGYKLSAGFSVAMPGNYTPLYGAAPVPKQQALFAGEKTRVKEIAAFVRAKEVRRFEEGPGFVNFLLHKLLYGSCSPRIPFLSRNFWVTPECNSCGSCSKVCPVRNIEMRDGRPVWLDHCQQCMACLQWCPRSAVQFGRSTRGRLRYRHPDVNMADIASQQALQS